MRGGGGGRRRGRGRRVGAAGRGTRAGLASGAGAAACAVAASGRTKPPVKSAKAAHLIFNSFFIIMGHAEQAIKTPKNSFLQL